MRLAIAFMMLLAANAFGAEPKESDELTIMRLKKANLEFALDNVQLQSEILKYKFDRLQADLKRMTAELEAKENKK